MRVCLVSREVAPFFGFGIGTYIQHMSRALVNAGHEVHVLTEPHEGLHEKGRQVLPRVRFHAVDITEGPAALAAYPTYPIRYAMGVYTALKHLHRKYNFDYIELPDY